MCLMFGILNHASRKQHRIHAQVDSQPDIHIHSGQLCALFMHSACKGNIRVAQSFCKLTYLQLRSIDLLCTNVFVNKGRCGWLKRNACLLPEHACTKGYLFLTCTICLYNCCQHCMEINLETTGARSRYCEIMCHVVN